MLLVVVCCVLLVVCCSSLCVDVCGLCFWFGFGLCSLCAVLDCCLCVVVCCLICFVCCSFCFYCLLIVGWYVLFGVSAVRCLVVVLCVCCLLLLFDARCLWFVGCCLMSVEGCLLFVICR